MKKKKYLIIASIFILLIILAVKFILPIVLSNYLAKRVEQSSDYSLNITHFKIILIKPGIVIDQLELQSKNAASDFSLLKTGEISIYLQWKDLLRGKIALVLMVKNPVVKFSVVPESTKKNQPKTLKVVDSWQTVTDSLFLAKFNKIAIENGEIHFIDKNERRFDFYVKDIQAKFDNLLDIERSYNTLPTHAKITGVSSGNGEIKLKIGLDTRANLPTFNVDAQMTNLNVPNINNFLHAYTTIVVKQGNFNIFIEAAAKNGKVTGYIKPYIKNLKVASTADNASLKEKLYRGIAKTVSKILKNEEKNSTATEVSIQGNIQDPNVSAWSAIANLLHHAFVQALLAQLDSSINFNSLQLKI